MTGVQTCALPIWEQKAAAENLFETVSLCDEQYAKELERLDIILPSAISDEFMSVWTNQTVMVRDARVRHAALLVERISGELTEAFKYRTDQLGQRVSLLAEVVSQAGGASNQLACAESARISYVGLAVYEQRLLDRLTAWKEARGEEEAQVAFDAVSTAQKLLAVQIRLARLTLCRLAWAVRHPQMYRLSAAHGGFEAVTPENMGNVQKVLIDQWAELGKAAATNIARLKQQINDSDRRLAAVYERLAMKSTVTDTDTPSIVWNKMLILLRVERKDQALAALDVFQKRQHTVEPGDTGVDAYVAAARAYIQQRYPDDFTGGVLVMGFADNKKHSSLRAGDIVLALDGQPVTTDDEFVVLKKARAGQAMQMSILRLRDNGTFAAIDISHQVSDPPIMISSLKYVE